MNAHRPSVQVRVLTRSTQVIARSRAHAFAIAAALDRSGVRYCRAARVPHGFDLLGDGVEAALTAIEAAGNPIEMIL